MGLLRLAVCVSGVYAAFLFWAIAQERLSAPFPSLNPDPSHKGDKFPSPLFLNYAQALASSLSAVSYLLFNAWRDGTLAARGVKAVLGFDKLLGSSGSTGHPKANGSNGVDGKHVVKDSNGVSPNGSAKSEKSADERIDPEPAPKKRSLLSLLLQVSLCQTMAGPCAFLALRHISYPTMVLGKSCKLIPVLLLNVILYRRRFSLHKYVVVALVTVGISLFMLFGPGGAKGKKGKGGSNSAWGLGLLTANLFIDGLTNSTQDQIFALYPAYTGQQMMAHMSLLSQLILLPALLLPLPSHPLGLLHRYLPFVPSPLLGGGAADADLALAPPAALTCVRFLASHPAAVSPLLAYAALGGLGQLFIFETIQHFGSLTLVMVTVTRKLFTMLLSVVVFEHKLSPGQWAGVGVVFAGIGVEAAGKGRAVKRKVRKD